MTSSSAAGALLGGLAGAAVSVSEGGTVALVGCSVEVLKGTEAEAEAEAEAEPEADADDENGVTCAELLPGRGPSKCSFSDGSDAGWDGGLFLAAKGSEITLQNVILSKGETGLTSIKG
jgi:hypothetical protein